MDWDETLYDIKRKAIWALEKFSGIKAKNAIKEISDFDKYL